MVDTESTPTQTYEGVSANPFAKWHFQPSKPRQNEKRSIYYLQDSVLLSVVSATNNSATDYGKNDGNWYVFVWHRSARSGGSRLIGVVPFPLGAQTRKIKKKHAPQMFKIWDFEKFRWKMRNFERK